MVRGLEVFREHFRDYADRYLLIGGAACDLAMSAAALPFRATKDLDIVLCVEALDAAFVQTFWEFVRAGGYENQEKATGEKQFYRFQKPTRPDYPFMLELFSRQPDVLQVAEGSHLTPLPVEEEASSLSAILLDNDYYNFIRAGRQEIEGVTTVGAAQLIALKARAWIDLTEREARGEKTAKVQKYLIQTDLVDTFGDVRLENIDKLALQTHLNQLAKTRSRDRVLHATAYLRAIFREAVEQDFLPKDPARTVKSPSELKETDKTTLTWDQLRAALARLPMRDQILLKLDMSNALRPGELFGLRWSCFDPEQCLIEIKETAYKGKIRPWGKTKGSLTKIPIAEQLAEELQAWREHSLEEQRHKKRWDGPMADEPEAFIFPGRHGSFIDSSNYRKRVLHKLAEELKLPKLTFQVIRRTIATLAKDKGHVKDIQGMMRHSRLATTTDVYMQSLEDGVRSTVNSIHDELSGTGTRGATRTTKQRFADHGRVQKNFAGAVASERQKPVSAKPVRGVILEFATRMRQSRGGEKLLND